MNFKPTILKTIISIIVSIFFTLLFMNSSSNFCDNVSVNCGDEGCCTERNIPISIFDNCSCSSSSLNEILVHIIIILFPGIIIFLIWSLLTNRELSDFLTFSRKKIIFMTPLALIIIPLIWSAVFLGFGGSSQVYISYLLYFISKLWVINPYF